MERPKTGYISRAIAQRRPGFEPSSGEIYGGQIGSEVGLSPITLVSPANSHSTSCSTFIDYRIIDAV